MKDYLIQFNADGRRGATYAAGVHYYVDDKGNAINGSVNIRKLLNDGYVFVETDDYLNLLGNNADHQEYCRQSDGTFAPYVAPEPTPEELQAQALAALDAEYQSKFNELDEQIVKAAALKNETLQDELIAERAALAEEYTTKRGEL